MNKTFNIELTEREMLVLVMALETAKNEEMHAERPLEEIVEELLTLRTKLRNVK